MEICIGDNDLCMKNKGLCCSGICNEANGMCAVLSNNSSPNVSITATPKHKLCIPDNNPCTINPDEIGVLGICCSEICNQLEGQSRGTCMKKPNTQIVNNTLNIDFDSVNGCIRNGASCYSNGSLGLCCSTFCLQFGAQLGKCNPKLPIQNDTKIDTSLIIGISLAVFAIVILIVILFLLRRMRKNMFTREEVYKFLRGAQTQSNEDTPMLEKIEEYPYDASYEILPAKFKIDQNVVLGKGEFGVVRKGSIKMFPNSEPVGVAVKTTPDDVDVRYVKALLSELKLMIYIGNHENVVTLLGACTSDLKSGRVYLFLELCSLGSVESYLRKYKYDFEATRGIIKAYANTPTYNAFKASSSLNMDDLHRWSLQIAMGFEYLSNKKVVHGDIAARNILLASRDVAKISDFGLSRRVYNYANYVKKHQEPLPWKWMAIESLQELTFSTQSDVWAVGVTLWEIFSLGNTPYPGLNWSTEFVNQLIENKIRLPKPIHGTEPIYDLLKKCWNVSPNDRPKPEEIVQTLKALKENYCLISTKSSN